MRIVFFQEIFNGSYLVVYSLQDSCCLFTISYRDIDMIFQIFAYSQSRFVHVKLPNPQTVGFEFHLQKVITTIGLRAGSLCFFCCFTALMRPNQVHTAVLAFSLDSIMSLSHYVFYVLLALLGCYLFV